MAERIIPTPARPALRLLETPAPLELPQAIEQEKAVLGSILLNREAILAVADTLFPPMFYMQRHADIYQAMLACLADRTPPDTRLVAHRLRERGLLDAVGGIAYLAELIDGVPTSYHIGYYAKDVINTARLRLLIDAGSKIAALGYGVDAEIASADAHAALLAATQAGAAGDLISADQAATESWERLTGEHPPLISTGWADLDSIIGGLAGGDLMVIGARPGMGKTSWALSLLRQLCLARRASPLIFELEMSREQLTHRLVCMETGISTQAMRARVGLDEATLQQAAAAHGTVGSWPWTICDFAGQTPNQIRARTFRHMVEHPETVVIVDYLGLMDIDGKHENRTQDVAQLSLALKRLARDANVPVIALSQLSRALETRPNKVPILSDLRDSGAVEQDADIVGFLYREEMYDKETDKKGIAELHIAKNRHGPLGVVPMRFDAATTRFDALSFRGVEGY